MEQRTITITSVRTSLSGATHTPVCQLEHIGDSNSGAPRSGTITISAALYHSHNFMTLIPSQNSKVFPTNVVSPSLNGQLIKAELGTTVEDTPLLNASLRARRSVAIATRLTLEEQ